MNQSQVCLAGIAWTPLGQDQPCLELPRLEFAAGERILLAGASGAGKSTLLRLLAGVLEPHVPGELTGSVTISGHPAEAGRPDVGFVAQQPFDALVAETVGSDLSFGPENLGLPAHQIPARVTQALELVGFPFPEHHPTGALSGGQAQRLALAGALAMQPQLLLLDEPCSMLDEPAAAQLRHTVTQVVDSLAATLVVADHNLAAWRGKVTRLVVLAAGRIVADGTFEEVISEHAAQLLALGLWVPGEPPPKPTAVSLAAIQPPSLEAIAVSELAVERISPLSLELRRAPARPVLSGVNLRLAAGELISLRGASGSGKTTLLATITGALAPSSGTVTLAGRADPESWRAQELATVLGWVPQFVESLAVGATVWESLTATASRLGQPEEQVAARARQLLRVLGLERFETRHPLSLSGGEQRRLAVACALLHGPSVVIADEPTVGLDRISWAAVVGLLLAARDCGSGVLVATHDAALAGHSDRRQELPPVAKTAVSPPPEAPGLLARAQPLTLLLAVVLLTASGLAAGGLLPLATGMAALLVTGAVAVAGRFPVRRLLAPAIGMLSVGWSNWLLAEPKSVAVAVEAALRVGFIATPGVVVAGYLNPSVLGTQLGAQLKLPARPVLAAVVALRQLDGLALRWQEIALARRIRGLAPGSSPLARSREWAARCFGLLVATVRQASNMAVAMDSRGFSAPGPRTWTGRPRWGNCDTWVVVLAVLVAGVPLALTLLGY